MRAKGIEKMLVTGAAGFIGPHTVDLLIERSYHVTTLGNLEPQVHGEAGNLPDYIDNNATFVHGDIRDRVLLRRLSKKSMP